MKWELGTFAKFVIPVEVKINATGEWIAYTIKRIVTEQNKTIRQIVVENLQTRSKFFLPENTTKPRFSFDGRQMVFLKKQDDMVSICLLELDHFSTKEILSCEGVSFLTWSQDSRKIIVVQPKKRKDEELFFEDTLPIWFDGKGFLDNTKELIQIIDVESNQVIDQFEERNLASVLFFEDSVLYAVADSKEPFTKFDVFLYKNGEKKTLLEKKGLIPTSAKNGKIVFLGRENKTHFQHDYVYLYDGRLHPITEKYGLNNSGHVGTEIWAAEGEANPVITEDGIYFKSGFHGTILLQKADFSGQISTVFSKNGVVTTFDVNTKGDLAFVYLDSLTPAEVYVLKSGQLQKVTSLNDAVISQLKVRPLEHFIYESFDKTSIDGWYLRPDKVPAPMVVFVHGGPKGAYGECLYFLGQLLTQEGFYVLYTNPRGSDNYSDDFAATVRGKVGVEDFKDIIAGAGVEWLMKKELITDVGITGISYGGFMTNWAITQTDFFKAAVSENGISYWFTSYAFSDIGFWFDKALIGEDPLISENYRKLSPIFHAKNVKTPLLLIHSLEDYRCPLDQSFMYYTVLKDLGKEVYIAIFKKGAHSHSVQGSYKHRLKRYKLIIEFFKQKLLQKSSVFDSTEIFK
nr:S9 family peptidase [Thermotoga profunda]